MTKAKSKILACSVSFVGGKVHYLGEEVSGDILAACEKVGASFAPSRPEKKKVTDND